MPIFPPPTTTTEKKGTFFNHSLKKNVPLFNLHVESAQTSLIAPGSPVRYLMASKSTSIIGRRASNRLLKSLVPTGKKVTHFLFGSIASIVFYTALKATRINIMMLFYNYLC